MEAQLVTGHSTAGDNAQGLVSRLPEGGDVFSNEGQPIQGTERVSNGDFHQFEHAPPNTADNAQGFATQLPEAEELTEKALLLSQTINAPDLSYQWQWQLGRILRATGENQKDRIDAVKKTNHT